MKKVMFISSDGGHLNELMELSPLFEQYSSTFVLEKNKRIIDLPGAVYILQKGTRKKLFQYFFIFGFNIFKSFFIFLKKKPDVIVTTGAHTAVPMCYIASMWKKEIYFIESIARVTSKSLTGKLIEKKATKIFVQWEEMLTVYDNAVYIGPIL